MRAKYLDIAYASRFTFGFVDVIIPAMRDRYRDWLRLVLIPGISSQKLVRLLAKFRSPDRILAASESQLIDALGEPKIAYRIVAYRDSVDVETELAQIERFGVSLISLEDDLYPTRLAATYGPPVLLYVRGTFLPRDADSVSIVGMRRASHYGRMTAERLAEELAAQGITVVSGMAAGIDSAAHRGALNVGGRTIAVLGCGVDVVYPQANRELAEKIVNSGCLISEFPMGTKPLKGNFPQRNRIISGMTLGTVVVEGTRASGSLITARRAMEQGRDVFAVPSRALSDGSQGPHALIRDGAKLTETARDILEEIEVHLAYQQTEEVNQTDKPDKTTRETEPASTVQPDTTEKKILAVLPRDPLSIDELAGRSNMSQAALLSALTMLEIKGLVRQLPGKLFVRL